MSVLQSILRIKSDQIIFDGPGTGKEDGMEVYPCTPTLMKRLGYSDAKIKSIRAKQLAILDNPKCVDNLRPYQIEDLKFLAKRMNGGCFNEQRTGKTPTSIKAMLEKGCKKILVVSPASMVYQWLSEATRWSDLQAVVVDGPKAKRERTIQAWTSGFLIIGYECLRRTTRKNDKTFSIEVSGDIDYISKHKDIDGIILDEAHRIKNHKSNQAEALFELSRKIPNKIALTGTPAPGKPMEIYSILHWLYPTIFTGYWRFIDYYFKKESKWGSNGEFTDITGFKSEEKKKELQEFLEIIATQRKRDSVMQWLPEKDIRVIKLECNPKQKEYLQSLKDDFEIEGTDINAATILTMLLRTRQICLGPATLGLSGVSPKAEWIKQYLKDYPEKNVIIFSMFTGWLEHLSEYLGIKDMITGKQTKKQKEEVKQKFQSGEIKVLLINIMAGNVGLTLDNADVTIFTDQYPPIGMMQQAEDRFVATTKDKLNRDHTIYKLIMKDTYEEVIYALLRRNAKEVDVINNFKEYLKNEK